MMAQPCLTIYDRLGGIKVLQRIVCDFYQNILCDDSVNIFYIENVSEISDLHHLMQDFLTMLFGGPNKYKGRDMVQAHKHMPIMKKHFEGVWKHMENSFSKHKANAALIAEIKVIIFSFTGDIITIK